MNSFGKIFQLKIFGSSHAPNVGIHIDGCPAGIPLAVSDFASALQRRSAGSFGTTARREKDIPEIQAGVMNGFTTGDRITISFENTDIRSEDYEFNGFFRPGHADFTSFTKYQGTHDLRGGGQASGRMTVALVAAGVVAQKLIDPVIVKAFLTEAGGSSNIETAVANAVEKKNSIGGIIECSVQNVPVGWGEPFFNSMESLISHAVFAIPGIKAIGFGAGIECAKMMGDECNDVFINAEGKTNTNHSGGINGGISNGNDIVFKVYVKPTSSIGLPQKTFNFVTGKIDDFTVKGRHDACFALRVPPVIEAVTAIVLADFKLQYSM
jgi:chorismate synthase